MTTHRTFDRWSTAGRVALGALVVGGALWMTPEAVQAATSPTVVVVSSTGWFDNSGNVHVDGTVQNNGPGIATSIVITVNYYNSSNTLLQVDKTTTDQPSLLAGDDSGFEDIFVNPPASYTYYTVPSVTASNGSAIPNIDFTTAVTNQMTDSLGDQVITGTVTNDNTASAQGVFVYFTFFNANYQTVYTDYSDINAGNQNALNAGQTVNFQLTVPNVNGIPAYNSYWYMAASGVSAPSGIPIDRLFGPDAIATAISVSQHEFPSFGSAKAVVLARSDFFSDAIAGGPLAAKTGGPLLVTPGASMSTGLDPRVKAEIQRVLPPGGTVYILGGSLALSPNIDSSLQSTGYVTRRIAGADEYATAVDVAEQLGNPSTVFEATGTDFADAMSAVPAAIESHGAILLTNGSQQSPETASYLAQYSPTTRYAIGGPAAADGADPSATPVYGQDVYGTSAAVASKFFPTPHIFGVATGASFADAFAGGVFMAAAASVSTGGPLLLLAPSAPLPPPVASYLSGGSANIAEGVMFGGPLALGAGVQAALETTA